MEKLQKQINLLVNSKLYFLFLTLLSFIFVLLFSRSTSPLYAYIGVDVACYKQMGMALLDGKTIYVDCFDNKGCLLIFINALCLWLGGDWVIMVFQTISLTISLLIMDKIISFYKTDFQRMLLILAALVLLVCFYNSGDLSEEWSFPFICYPLYIFVKSYNDGIKLKFNDLFAIGLCFGVISFLRINNAIPFCGFLAILFINYLINKQWKEFVIKMLAFIIGVIIIAFPCFLYFYLKAGVEGVNSMVYATFTSGFKYIAISVDNLITADILYSIPYYLIVFLFLTIYLIFSHKDKKIVKPVVIAYLLFLLGFGTRTSEHYQIVMIPLYVLCLSTIKIQIKWLKYVLLFVAAANLLIFLIKPFGYLFEEFIFGNDKFEKAYAEFHEVITKNIPDEERDSIYNYNTDLIGSALLYNEKLAQNNPVLFTTHAFIGMMEHQPISEEKPLWVMVCDSYYYLEDMTFLQENYEEKFLYHYDTIYYDWFGMKRDIYFFRRK